MFSKMSMKNQLLMINKSCATSLSKLRRYLTYSIRSRIASGAKKRGNLIKSVLRQSISTCVSMWKAITRGVRAFPLKTGFVTWRTKWAISSTPAPSKIKDLRTCFSSKCKLSITLTNRGKLIKSAFLKFHSKWISFQVMFWNWKRSSIKGKRTLITLRKNDYKC